MPLDSMLPIDTSYATYVHAQLAYGNASQCTWLNVFHMPARWFHLHPDLVPLCG